MSAKRLDALRFTVPGLPVTQGPTNPAQVADYPRLMQWRNDIAVLARAARRGCWPTVMPPECVSVFATFRLARLKSGIWSTAAYPGGRHDLDKLERALGDAMRTAGVYWDDAQVVDWVASKRFANPDAGVEVLVVLAAGDGR